MTLDSTTHRRLADSGSVAATARAVGLAVGSMLCFQTGAALSVPLLLSIGPAATTWLRLVGGAALLWAITRPALARCNVRALSTAGCLGAATGGMACLYAEAVARIPLGIATAIEFLGPLAVAVAMSRRLLDVVWAVLAGLGVALLTLGASGRSGDVAGVACAFAAAGCWAAYILLTKRVGQVFSGLQGLAISLMVAALVTAPFGIGQLRGSVRGWEVGAALLLGLVVPVLPYGMELLALRRMSTRGFGILMSADPAISALVGWLVLSQSLGMQRIAGIMCVVVASVGTTASRPIRTRSACE